METSISSVLLNAYYEEPELLCVGSTTTKNPFQNAAQTKVERPLFLHQKEFHGTVINVSKIRTIKYNLRLDTSMHFVQIRIIQVAIRS